MYPLSVEPTPILTFSIRTLSFTLNGKESVSLNPDDNVTVTSFLFELYDNELIPTPLLFFVGIIVGIKLLIPLVFLRIDTSESPKEYLRSKSDTTAFVLLSTTTRSGELIYPFPTEDIPIDSIEYNGSILTIWGIITDGLNVLSDGKLYPILSIDIFLILPIVWLEASTTALIPNDEVIVDMPGKEL